MNGFRFPLVWLLLFALVGHDIIVMRPVTLMGRERQRWPYFWAVVLFFPIFHLAAFGPVIGDVGGYVKFFKTFPDTWTEIWDFVKGQPSGGGFYLIEGLIKIAFGENVTAFRVILAALHSIPIVLLYRRYSENYLISVYLFVATCSHIAWMMNGLRQFLAAVIVYAATPFMIKKKYIHAAGFVLFASTIHLSAIIMLPLIFVATGKAWNKRTIFYIILAIIGMFVFGQNAALMDLLLSGTEYENSISMWQKMGDDGVNPVRVLVSAVPVIIAVVGKKQIEFAGDEVDDFLINMSIVNLGIYLIAMVTSGIMVGRLSAYTGLYNHILLPNLLGTVFEKESERLLTWLLVFFYLIYFWYAGGFR